MIAIKLLNAEILNSTKEIESLNRQGIFTDSIITRANKNIAICQNEIKLLKTL